jgi:hypothetical protein
MGNAGKFGTGIRDSTLNTISRELIYLDLLRDGAKRFGLSIWAYCLMSNHVHLLAVPSRLIHGHAHQGGCMPIMPVTSTHAGGVAVTFGKRATFLVRWQTSIYGGRWRTSNAIRCVPGSARRQRNTKGPARGLTFGRQAMEDCLISGFGARSMMGRLGKVFWKGEARTMSFGSDCKRLRCAPDPAVNPTRSRCLNGGSEEGCVHVLPDVHVSKIRQKRSIRLLLDLVDSEW